MVRNSPSQHASQTPIGKTMTGNGWKKMDCKKNV